MVPNCVPVDSILLIVDFSVVDDDVDDDVVYLQMYKTKLFLYL
jgi:hypothetical protein